MEAIQYHNAKRVFPSALGLHMEFETYEQALAFYQDGTSRGMIYALAENTVIKPFKG
jgi:hypothetical protein